MNYPFLSICIPTYNGTQCLYDNVISALSIDSDEIEIVISDNCSSDQRALNRVREIDDCRLKVYINETNEGPFKNWYLALKRGTGKYLMLVQDNNSVIVENYSDFLDFIKTHDFDIIKNAYHNVCRTGGSISNYRYAYCGVVLSHASYVMYKKEAFDNIPFIPESFDAEFTDYPYIVWDLYYLNGVHDKNKRVYINNDIEIIKLPDCSKQEQGSRTRDFVSKKNSSYSFEREKHIFLCCLSLLRKLNRDDNEYAKWCLNLFRAAIYRSTVSYYAHLVDDYARKRYGVSGDINCINFEKLEDDIANTALREYRKSVRHVTPLFVVLIYLIKYESRLELYVLMRREGHHKISKIYLALHELLFNGINLLTN